MTMTRRTLLAATAALTRGYARNFETADQISRAVSQIVLYDLPDDYFARFVPEIERVTQEEVSRVAAARLDPSRLTTLVVGDADAVAGELGRLGLGAPAMVQADTL